MAEFRMLVASHKEAPMPNDDFYLPIQVGHVLRNEEFGYQVDSEGDNISGRNASYCELTAHYWAWKNLESNFIGLSHYRRYFRGTAPGPNGKKILERAEAEALLSHYDLIVAKPRNYIIETIRSHYENSHFGDDLIVVREAINELSPELAASYGTVLSRRSMSLYNMFLMSSDELNRYSNWLFSILEEAERHIDNSVRSPYEQRTFGYLAEVLLNVWVESRQDELKVAYLPVVNIEGEPKIRKGLGLLNRKLYGHTPR